MPMLTEPLIPSKKAIIEFWMTVRECEERICRLEQRLELKKQKIELDLWKNDMELPTVKKILVPVRTGTLHTTFMHSI